MISAVMILNEKGDVLVSRSYRDQINMKKMAEMFRTQVIMTKQVDRCPVRTIGSMSFMHLMHSQLILLAITKRNVNSAMVFTFLKRMINIIKSYFGSINEQSLKDNFVVIYEIMDEILDFGYPQNTDADILKLYISAREEKKEMKLKDAKSISIQATGALSWRPEGIMYKKNEVFLDVVEKVNLLMSASGNVLSSDVNGRIIMKSFLSGMPDCKLGLNDKGMMSKEREGRPSMGANPKRKYQEIEIDNVTFHQCVKLSKYGQDRVINFIPPDKEFELMRYNISDRIIIPFKLVSPMITEFGKTRLEIKLTVKSLFDSRLFATNVVVTIPVPKNVANCKMFPNAGTAKYDAPQHAILWKIAKFPGNAEYALSGEVNLIATTSGKDHWSKPPISLDFTVTMFTASGLNVRFLKIYEKSNYQAVKWVRYITKAGKYENRI